MRVVTALTMTVVVAAVSLALAACTPPAPSVVDVAPDPAGTTVETAAPSGDPLIAASDQAVFVSVVDGDTIETSLGTVRIIGIDTPERGECGHDQASATIASVLAAGDTVRLDLPVGQNDQDRHGRLLRYVATHDGADIGMLQIQAGTAVARYDSLDGYPGHPNEGAYHADQLAWLGPDGAVVTVACAASTPAAPPATTDRWWEQYTSCTKLKKNTVGHPIGPFNVNDPAQADAYDWFANQTGNNGDGDGDGLACE